MIDEKNVFYQSGKNDLRTHDHIRKTVTGEGDDYRADCLLDYPYFKKYYKMITIDLSKEQVLDAD